MQIPDYNLWYQQMEGSESRTYANLTDPNYDLLLILEDLQQLTSFRLPEYELKRDLYVHALANQMSEEEEASYDTLQLTAIAYTPAWLGTGAVFLVRGLLEEEVDDEELGLRIRGEEKAYNNCELAANVEGEFLLLNTGEEAFLELFTLSGVQLAKLVLRKESIVDLSAYSQIGFYRVTSGKCYKTGKWILAK